MTTLPDERRANYHRDAATRRLFGASLAFGFLNAVLGPALPYLRATEHLTYLTGSLHQAAYAVGGGLAGGLAARRARPLPRAPAIAFGFASAGLAGVAVGYGNTLAITLTAALAMSLLGTSALIRIRIWAGLSDHFGSQRTIALAEGEVFVSLGGIVAPLLVGALAATLLRWRSAFVIGAALCMLAALMIRVRGIAGPDAIESPPEENGSEVPASRSSATLIIIFAIVALEFSLSFWLASYLSDSVHLARQLAVLMVSGLYVANLAGRVIASRLARRIAPAQLLGASLVLVGATLPILLLARGAVVAALGIATVGTGIGATFPVTSSLHVAHRRASSDAAVGEVMAVACPGQLTGPLVVGALAQLGGLRAGLLTLPVLTMLAIAGLVRHRSTQERAPVKVA